MKRVSGIALAVLILLPLAIIGVQVAHDPGSDQAGAPVANANEQVIKGQYLTLAGNCMGCHTPRGGAPYAGGRAIGTPFGNIYSSNITPDMDTGIGSWTADDFWRAIHNGKSKDGKFLYPAFPYPNYTKVTRTDSDAMFAYLRTVKPVRQASKEHELRFPYNQRILLAFWRSLYFSPGEYQAQANQSQEWNRGAYLVQGLGHCSACHTSRNALGGTVAGSDLAGGMIPMQNWYASSLTSDSETGIGDWEVKDIADLLHTGVSKRGAVFGPMSEVVAASLQHLHDNDIQAMASYLKSIPERDSAPYVSPVRVADDAQAVLKLGASLYDTHCVECHKADGKGVPPAYPPLAGNRSLSVQSTINPIRMVLNGGYPPTTKGNQRPYGMPPFSAALDDKEVAAVVSYIRMSWGNNGSLVSPNEVSRYRGTPAD
jgi:mono/diheme cytochrome c family protein